MKLGLENITRLLRCVGDPHHAFPAVLVAGTNGKGSVTTYVSSILRAAGCRVGTFYSPHIFRIEERIRLDGDEIPAAELDSILGMLRRQRRTATFTFFEGLTAAAAVYFKKHNVDIAVFEVGLGGRLDATRLVNAAVTVVTGISKDHELHLGTTRGRILDEKLGIARSGVPLVGNLGNRRLASQAARRCAAIGAPFFDVHDEVAATVRLIEPQRMLLSLETPVREYVDLETRMIGTAQARNAATAVRVAEVLDIIRRAGPRPAVQSNRAADRSGMRTVPAGDGSPSGHARITERAIRDGMRRAFLPCRFQVLAGSPRIVLDVSHNEEGLLAALETLRLVSPAERSVLVFGVMANKELGRFPRRAVAAFREIVCTSLGKRRSMPSTRLAGIFGEEAGRGRARVTAERGMAGALRAVRRIARSDDTVVICGSHHAVEEAVAYL